MPDLVRRLKGDNSMALKRECWKVCTVMARKSCVHGEAAFAEPKSPVVKACTHRSIPEAMAP
jgi:hypothetical protein